MHQILTEREQRLIRDLREQEERVREPVEENLRQIQENLNSIQEILSKLQKQMEQKDGLIFLKEETRQKRRISDDGIEVTLADDALSVEKFDRPLQFMVWREIINAIHPGKTHICYFVLIYVSSFDSFSIKIQ
uniref:E3 ubiquitin-protein ligase TRIM69-like n=1 Tax=Pristiophorus japonicus TaxID=55135 RepID=UPI00398E660D